MATIEYSDGTKIDFSGSPTEQDVQTAYDQVKGTTKPAVIPPITPPIIPQANGLQGVGVGLAKGLISTATGLSTLGGDIARQTIGRVANLAMGNGFTAPARQQVPEAFTPNTPLNQALTQPQGGSENIGFGTEKLAEFLLPTGEANAVTKAGQGLVKGTGILSKIARGTIKAGTEALTSGAVSTAQQGGINDQVKTNAIVGGLFSAGGSLAGEALGLASKGLQKVGQKIQTSVIKPSTSDIADGFRIENLKKYGIGGSNEQVMAQTANKLNSLSDELGTKLKGSNTALNLNNVYEETVNALGGNKAKDFGNIQGVQRVLQSLKGEIGQVAGENGLVGVPEAQLVKQGAGTKGSWVFGSADPDATAVEKVYNKFYNILKTKIEEASPEGVKEINKQISELIPIQRAVIRRIPIENRNSAISLNDSVALYGSLFNPKALALLGAGRLSKSGKFGNFLVNVADNFKNPQSAIGKRVLGQANQVSENTNQIKQAIPNPINSNITNSIQKGAIDVNALTAGAGTLAGGTALGNALNKTGVTTSSYNATTPRSETDPSIIEGYNISKYATDPKHEERVNRIYSTVPETNDGKSLDTYINAKFPKSPLTGEMIYFASRKYGVPVRLLVAIMQQDSGLGTKGLGVKTNNPGNVGNNDEGKTVTYPSWQEGINGVARFLSKHKVK